MSNTNGQVSFVKSMNGILSFNTGSGTTIEGDSITTDIINCDTLNTTNFNATNLNTDNIQGTTPSSNITLYTNSTGNITIGSPNSLNYINGPLYVDTIFTSTTSANAFLFSTTTGDVNLGSSTIPLIGEYVCTQPTHLANKSYVDSKVGVNLLPLPNVWTGTSNTFNNKIVVDIINASSPFLYISLYGNVTNSIQLGAGLTTSGILSLGPFMTSGSINIGAEATAGTPGNPTINIGNDFGSNSISLRTLGTVNLGTNASTINIGTTTGTTIGIGSTTSNITVNSSALSLNTNASTITINKPIQPNYDTLYNATNGAGANTNIGYVYSRVGTSGGNFAIGADVLNPCLNLTLVDVGVYLLSIDNNVFNSNSSGIITLYYQNISIGTTSLGADIYSVWLNAYAQINNATSPNQQLHSPFSYIYTNTTANRIIYTNMKCGRSAAGLNWSAANSFIKAVRIA